METNTVILGPTAESILTFLRDASEARAHHLVLLFPKGRFPTLSRLDQVRAGMYLKRVGSVTIAELGGSKDSEFLGEPVLSLRNAAFGLQFVLSLPRASLLGVFAESGDGAALQAAVARGGSELLFGDRNLIESVGVPFGNEQFQFHAVPAAGAVLGGGTLTDHAVIPSKAASTGVVGVASDSFTEAKIRSLYAGENLRFIGERSFAHCQHLEDVLLPNGMELIGKGAFSNCPALRSVRLPESIRIIGDGAFVNCSPELELEVVPGSSAHIYAERNGLAVRLRTPQASTTERPGGQLLSDRGATYLTLPGGAAQVVRIRRRTRIPAEVAGRAVVGVGPEVYPASGHAFDISLPATLRWVVADAFAGVPDITKVTGLRRVPFQNGRPDVRVQRRVHDFDRVRVTPRMLARILGARLPAMAEPIADRPVTGVANKLVTITEGNAFFVRTNRPGRRVVDRALEKGAQFFVATRRLTDGAGKRQPTLVVPDPTLATIEIAAWFKSQYASKTIALTGSVGKTTTKEMLRRVAQTQFDTIYNTGNANVHSRVLRIIQRQSFQTQVYIQETGAQFPGHVEMMARMLRPDAFVVTNIGLNHVGDYGDDPNALLQDKLSLDRHLPEDGVAFLCYDDPKLREQTLSHPVISYSVSDAQADYSAKEIDESEGRLEFLAVEKETGLEFPIVVRAFGIHNVANALVAFAVGRWLQIPAEKIAQGIRRYKGVGLRQNLASLAGRKVLIDCYNASEVSAGSVAGALQSITPGPGGKRYLVFADIDDKLGEATEEVHRRVGKNLAAQRNIDRVFLFGEHAGWTAEEMGLAGANAFHTADRNELQRALEEALTSADVVAFKGGQQMALSINIDNLFGSAFSLLDADVVRTRGEVFTRDGFGFNQMQEYGLVLVSIPTKLPSRNLVLPGDVDGEPVRVIGTRAASRSLLRSAEVSAPIRTIADRAFERCLDLRVVSLPITLEYVGEGAFAGCESLTEISIPQGVRTIEAEAFAGCSKLQRAVIPSSVKTIGDDVFSGCPELTALCDPGSYAYRYCAEAGIPTRSVQDSTMGEE